MNRLIAVASLVLVLALSACASSGERMSNADRLTLLRAHAGEPVNSIRHPGRFAGWSSVGNSALVLRPRTNQAFLLELSGPCPDLSFAHAIRVSSRSGTIASRFDSITPVGPGTSSIRIRCHIRSIQPLDMAALRQTKAELREATSVEREAEDASTDADDAAASDESTGD